MTSEGHVGFLKGVFATLAAIAALIAIYEFFLKNYINVPQVNVQPTSAQISQQPTLGAAIPTTSQGANSNPTTQPPVAVQPTTSGDDVGGYIPMSPEEAASLFWGSASKSLETMSWRASWCLLDICIAWDCFSSHCSTELLETRRFDRWLEIFGR